MRILGIAPDFLSKLKDKKLSSYTGPALVLFGFFANELVKNQFFQDDSISPYAVISLIDELFNLLHTKQSGKLDLYTELKIMGKELLGSTLTEEEKKYDSKFHELDVPNEIANGLKWAMGFSMIRGVYNSVSLAVTNNLTKHVPNIIAFTAAAYAATPIASALIENILSRISYNEETKKILRQLLRTVVRLATTFIPRASANEHGVTYQYPDLDGYHRWYKNIAVDAPSTSSAPSYSHAEKDSVDPSEEKLPFKITGITFTEKAPVEMMIMTEENKSLTVKFNLVEKGDQSELQIECSDEKYEGKCFEYLTKVFVQPSVQQKIINQLPTPSAQETDLPSSFSGSLIDRAVDLASVAVPSMMAATVSPSLALGTFFLASSRLNQVSAKSTTVHHHGKRSGLTPNVQVQVNNPTSGTGGNVGYDPSLGVSRTAVATDSKGGILITYESAAPIVTGGTGVVLVKSYNPDIAEMRVDPAYLPGNQAVPSVAISQDNGTTAAIVWQGQAGGLNTIYALPYARATMTPLITTPTEISNSSTAQFAPQATFRPDPTILDVYFCSSSNIITQAVNVTSGNLIGSPFQVNNETNAFYPSVDTAGPYQVVVWQGPAQIMAWARDFSKGTSSTITGIGSPGGVAPIISCAKTLLGADCAVSVGSASVQATNGVLIPLSIDGTGATPVITTGNSVAMPGQLYIPYLTAVALQKTAQAGSFNGVVVSEGQINPNSSFDVITWRFTQSGTSINMTGASFSPLTNSGGTNIIAPSVAALGDALGSDTYVVAAPSLNGLGDATNGYDMVAIAFTDGFNGTQPKTSSPPAATTITVSSGTTGSKKGNKNIGPIVGGVVAGVVGVSVITGLVAFGFLRHKNNNDSYEIEMQRTRSDSPFADALHRELGISNFDNFNSVEGGNFKDFAEQIKRAMTQGRVLEETDLENYAVAAAQVIKDNQFIDGKKLNFENMRSYGAEKIAGDAQKVNSKSPQPSMR